MTRINCIPPAELVDKHLIAEYRELPRVFKLASKASKSISIPKTYCLGTGHMKFFYNKLKWLVDRQEQLIAECIRRGFDIKHKDTTELIVMSPSYFWNNWEPTAEAMALNRQRINERLQQMGEK